jgi:hypothetical protein
MEKTMTKEITIKPDGKMFDVHQGDKSSGPLGWDEMLGLVASLTISYKKPCQQWMRTKEQHEAWKSGLKIE